MFMLFPCHHGAKVLVENSYTNVVDVIIAYFEHGIAFHATHSGPLTPSLEDTRTVYAKIEYVSERTYLSKNTLRFVR